VSHLGSLVRAPTAFAGSVVVGVQLSVPEPLFVRAPATLLPGIITRKSAPTVAGTVQIKQ